VRLCSRWDLSIRARAVFHEDAALVRVRAGGLTYLLEPHEAQLLARELLDSLKQIEAVCAIDGGQTA
jgi:hypothetical protein